VVIPCIIGGELSLTEKRGTSVGRLLGAELLLLEEEVAENGLDRRVRMESHVVLSRKERRTDTDECESYLSLHSSVSAALQLLAVGEKEGGRPAATAAAHVPLEGGSFSSAESLSMLLVLMLLLPLSQLLLLLLNHDDRSLTKRVFSCRGSEAGKCWCRMVRV
jgi:hypothetical protein